MKINILQVGIAVLLGSVLTISAVYFFSRNTLKNVATKGTDNTQIINTTEPTTSTKTDSTIKPTASTKNNCPINFKFTETDLYTMCIPQRFNLQTYKNWNGEIGIQASYNTNSSNETLNVHEQFIGGWGPNPCLKKEKVMFLGKSATQMLDIKNLSESEEGDPNLVCGEATEAVIYIPNEKWSLSLSAGGEPISVTEFNIMRDSFKLKK